MKFDLNLKFWSLIQHIKWFNIELMVNVKRIVRVIYKESKNTTLCSTTSTRHENRKIACSSSTSNMPFFFTLQVARESNLSFIFSLFFVINNNVM